MSSLLHPETREKMPEGIHNVYWFEVFNTASWSVVLQSPMLLFLTHLNASAVVLACAGSLSPLLNVLQIPAAQYVERVGYQRFVLAGWTSRSVMVIGMSLVAFIPMGWISNSLRMVLFFVLIFLYNVLRGISVCGLLPWFTQLVPESRRGEFLAKDQFAGGFAMILSLMTYSILLADTSGFVKQENVSAFGFVFAFGALGGFISLHFLRRIPDIPVEKIARNPERTPWREMFLYPPFFRYMIYNMVINVANGAGGVFWVPMFRKEFHLSASGTLFIASATFMVTTGSVYLFGSVIDRVGNRPVLMLSAVVQIIHYLGWASIVAQLLPFNLATISLQCLTAGIATALWNIGNVRMVMGIIPQMGRAHFLALYSVASSLTVGLAPLAWGPVLDALVGWRYRTGMWQWNAYSLLYLALGLNLILGLILLIRLKDPGAMTWDQFMRELLVKTPSRGISRLMNRMRGSSLS